MSELSNRQKRYLLLQKRHHLIVNLSRLLILSLFLGLWEITSRLGMIDSFVFSSPAKIVRCFWSMVLDRSIFHHLGITLYETILSFLFVTGISILIAVILWYSKKLSEILDPYLVVLNSLPKSALAPLLIVWLGANQTTIIIAGMSVAIFGSILNLYTSFTTIDQAHLHTPRNETQRTDQSGPAKLHSRDHQQYEGQYRPVSCGCDHRRIFSGQKRTRIPDHLLQSGF